MREHTYINIRRTCLKKFKPWFSELTAVGKVSFLATMVLGSLFTVSAISPTTPTQNITLPDQPPVLVEKTEPVAHPTPAVVEKAEPVTSVKIETENEIIPYSKQTISDSNLNKGATEIQTAGVDGFKTITYTITLVDGVETDRTSVETITIEPVSEITTVGTYVKPASNCDPNYSGCVPIASDVDCAGGGGNGPAYTSGPVKVIGVDIYGLDRDGDGWGCE